MHRLLSDADRALGRLQGSIETLPNPDLFVFMYVRKEAVLSSQIEGTQASINDLLKAEADVMDPHTPRDVDEVINYVSAMNHGLERLSQLPLSIRLIREIHAKLLTGVRGNRMQPGDIRRSQNWIGPAGSTLLTATFVPPPHREAEEALSDLEKFLHQEDDIPLLIRIGMAHAQFETIHPFLDGNGRCGRPTTTVNDVRDYLGISFPNANNMIDKFVQHGVLNETIGQVRNRVFLYSPYVDLFSRLDDH